MGLGCSFTSSGLFRGVGFVFVKSRVLLASAAFASINLLHFN